MRAHKKLIGGCVVVLAGLLALAAGPCVEHRSLDNGLSHFRVAVTDISGVTGGDGTPADPYSYPEGEVTLTFNATAYDKQGVIMDCQGDHLCYEETANVIVYPTAASTGFHGYVDPDSDLELAELFHPVLFQAGRVEGLTATTRNLHGRANLTVTDMHLIGACESDADCWGGLKCLEGQCSVQGMLRPIPQERLAGTQAMGASRDIYFDQPSLRNIQIDDHVRNNLDIDSSALNRYFVDIDCRKDDPAPALPDDGHGKLVVTGIFNEGFFVTDLADADDGEGFNHLYVFNYSYPDDLAVGDRLDRLVGTSQDFSGATQISFPSWTRATDARLNPEPFRVEDLDAAVPPVLVTTAMCENDQSSSMHLCGHSKTNWVLEELESARVRLENIRLPDIFVDCDFNHNGEITFSYPTPDEETDCRDFCLEHDGGNIIVAKEVIAKPEVMQAAVVSPCNNHGDCASGQCGGFRAEEDDGICRVICPWEADIPDIRPNCMEFRVPPQYICSELSTMRQFGQWSVALDNGAGPLINLLTRESLVNLDPSQPEFLGTTVDYVQGNLRQVRAARPRWIVLVGLGEADSPPELKD